MDSLTLMVDTLSVLIVKNDTFEIMYQDCEPEDFEITYGDNVVIKQIKPGRKISSQHFSLFFGNKDLHFPKIKIGVPFIVFTPFWVFLI